MVICNSQIAKPIVREVKRWATVVLIVTTAGWCYANREVTYWRDSVPGNLQGTWMRVEQDDADLFGVRAIRLSSQRIVLVTRADGESQRVESFLINKVSITARRGAESGRAVVFYGEPSLLDDINKRRREAGERPYGRESITRNRLQLDFGRGARISVQEIVPDGTGDDQSFDVGEFVRPPR